MIPPPPIGVDLPCRCYAATVPLKLDTLGLLTLDFKGGINFCVRTSKEEGLVLEIQGSRMEADRNPNTPNSGTLIAITMSNATPTPLSVLQPSSTGGLEMFLYLSLTVEVIDKATKKTTCILSTDPRKYATLKATDVRSFPQPTSSTRCRSRSRSIRKAAARARGPLQPATYRLSTSSSTRAPDATR